MYEALMCALKQQEDKQGNDKEQKDYLLQANNKLSKTIEHQEERCHKLEIKNEKIKKYKKMFDKASHFICKLCGETVKTDMF